MPSAVLMTVLGFGHVLSAVMWLGGGLLTGFVIGPSLRSMSPPASLEFNAKVLPKIVRFVRMAVVSTYVFGILLLYFFQDGDMSWLMNSTQGYIISTGVLLALVAGILGLGYVIPAFGKVSKLSAEALQSGKPPAPEMMNYGKRARTGSMAAVFLLLVVLAMMVTSGFAY
ncbi:MAG TPA: hypothetical protein VLY82_08280 [Nitrososphaerales archaeon]|nr:hypothetical protein [Nitrososphaerales archaeon]